MIPLGLGVIGLLIAGTLFLMGGKASASEKIPDKAAESVVNYDDQTKKGQRKEEFLPDGKRKQVSSDDVRKEWESINTDIPSSYAIATGKHESNNTLNEKDTEGSGFVSKGIYQISDEEEKDAGFSKDDAYDLVKATGILSNLANKRWKVLKAAGEKAKKDGKPYVEDDLPAYLVIAHNQGEGAAEKTIAAYGVDWKAYKKRNKGGYFDKLASYGDDAIPASSASGFMGYYVSGIH
jgi:hypothetical protein